MVIVFVLHKKGAKMNNKDFSQIKLGDKLQVSPDFLRNQIKGGMEDKLAFEVVRIRSDGFRISNGKMSFKITPPDRWWVTR